MKKKVFIIVASIVGMLIFANIYAYVNNSKIQSYMTDLSLSRKKIVLLDEFRGDIVQASQHKKLYILTGKDSYQAEYENVISSIDKQINEYYDKGYLTASEKSKLLGTMESFDSFSSNYKPTDNLIKINTDTESQMLSYNSNQIKILHQITLDISSQDQASKQNNDMVSLSSDNQTKLIQFVSSTITVLGSGIALYFKKRFNKQDVNFEDIVEYLTSHDTKESPTNNVNELKNHITQNEFLLSNAKLLYKQSIKFQNECERSTMLLKEIDMYIKRLKSTLELIDNYPTSAQRIILEDIEKQLNEFKVSFKSLPNFNEFIMDISENMIDKQNRD